VSDADREFLLRVYASTREHELASLAWSDQQRAQFLAMQFDVQDRSWRQQRPGACFDVVLIDGVPAGRLYVDRTPEEIVIVDIALLPEFCGRGIGSELLRSLLDEADASALPLRLHVAAGNPALRLYRRLGFVHVAEDGVYILMQWRPRAESE
jgi:ribosomal protein S18 acetylase RimI-like enzyme